MKLAYFFIAQILGFFSIAQPYLGKGFPALYEREGNIRFQSSDYWASKHLFESSLYYSQNEENYYHRAVSSIASNDASGMFYVEEFILKYPLHVLAHQAKFYLANKLYKERNFPDAAIQYATLSTSFLSKKLQEQSYFEKAYSLLQIYATEQAKEEFKKAYEYKGENQFAAAYYIGTLSQEEDAKDWLLKTQDDELWFKKSAIYLSKIYLKEKEYDALLKQNIPLIGTEHTLNNYYLLIYSAEAYYNQKLFNLAINYYEKGIGMEIQPPSSETLFKLGHAYYEVGEIEKAIDALKKSGLNDTPTGQASAFHLGKIYSEQNKLSFALHAFNVAAKNNFDPKIQEEALFLTGKINIKLLQYSQAIIQLTAFTSQYTKSAFYIEAEELLSHSFKNASDYDAVIAHFQKQKINTAIIKENYQQVTFIKGLQAFSDRDIEAAKKYFIQATQYPIDKKIAKEAYYWLGETYFILSDSTACENAYNKSLEIDKNYPLPHYGLGYLAYNQKNYKKSKAYFSTFIKKVSQYNHPFRSDAMLRMSDCDYALKNYDKALLGYLSLKGTQVPQDYISFQTGLIEQMQGNTKAATEAYEKVEKYEESPYKDNALFQKATTYFEAANFEKSKQYFSEYSDLYPNENAAPWAYNKRALGNLNTGKYDSALQDYTFVLDNFIEHEAAKDAILGVQELQKQGISVDFDRYFEKYQNANPDNQNVSTLHFEQAKHLFMHKNMSKR